MGRVLPTVKQFRSWSKPNQYGFVASVITILGALIGVTWFFYPESKDQKPSIEQADIIEAVELGVDTSQSDANEPQIITQLAIPVGNDARTNYSIFLRSYYGVGGYPALGKGLLESLDGVQIQWAVRVSDVYLDESNKGALLIIKPLQEVCSGNSCPSAFSDLVPVAYDSIEGVIAKVKIDQIVEVRGLLSVIEPLNNDKHIPILISPQETELWPKLTSE